MRLDLFLVENNYFESRQKAQLYIKDGFVVVNGKVISKASFEVGSGDIVEVIKKNRDFVSLGGFKIQKAIDDFKISLSDKIILDIGASTGGFTDCAIQNGAKLVYALDVGTNQLHSLLRNNSKVIFFENTDIRDFCVEKLNGHKVDWIVADLSFISFMKYFDFCPKFLDDSGKIIVLIKPQFEAGFDNIGKNGIVNNFAVHLKILDDINNFLNLRGFFINNITYAPVLKNKNIEYLVLISNQICTKIDFKAIVNEAFEKKKGND